MLKIFLFGQLRALADGAPLKLGMPPKTLPLWAYLLLQAGPVSRDTLAALLWPDDSEAEARANLRRHLYQLQRALPAPPIDRPWLLTTADTIGWNPAADYWLDVAEFERLSSDPATQPQATELYTGDLLIYAREAARALSRLAVRSAEPGLSHPADQSRGYPRPRKPRRLLRGPFQPRADHRPGSRRLAGLDAFWTPSLYSLLMAGACAASRPASGKTMEDQDRKRHLFFVRIWHEAGPGVAVDLWRGSVEESPGGPRYYFTTLAGLSDFITLRLGSAGAASPCPAPGDSSPHDSC